MCLGCERQNAICREWEDIMRTMDNQLKKMERSNYSYIWKENILEFLEVKNTGSEGKKTHLHSMRYAHVCT